MRLAYIRVSTIDQNEQRQVEAMQKYNIDINNNCNYTGETPLATFTQSEFTDATLTKYFGLEIMDRWSRAGDYVGTMQYSFECSPVAE